MNNRTVQSDVSELRFRCVARAFLIVFGSLCFTAGAWAQSAAIGALRVRVVDQDWDVPLAGAMVHVVEAEKRLVSGEDGNVLFDSLPGGSYTLVVSAPGFERKVLTQVIVVPGEAKSEEIRLGGAFTDMEEFVVKDIDIMVGGGDVAQLEIRSQSSGVMDNIGSDMMSKAGVGTAAAALRMVTGASVQDGKYAVIRGLGDRYTSTMLNGVRLPTADKDKRAVQMDQFPTAMIESIQITKSFMPDQQGDASGGGINIVTRGVPKEPVLSASFSTEYDTEATGNSDFKTYKDGGNNFGGMRGVQHLWFWNPGKLDTPRGTHNSVPDTITGKSTTVPDEKYSSRLQSSAPPMNSGFKFAAGDVWKLGEESSAGVLLNGSYSQKYKYRDSVKQGIRNDGGTKATNVVTDLENTTLVFTSTDEQLWSAGLTAGVKNQNNEIKLTGIYSHLSRDIVELRYDDTQPEEYQSKTNKVKGKVTGYEEDWRRGRSVNGVMQYAETANASVQLAGKHTIEPLNDTEIDWTGAYNVAESTEPDRRAFKSNYNFNRHINYDKNHIMTSSNEVSKMTTDDFQRRWQDTREEAIQGQVNMKTPYSLLGNDGYVKGGLFGDYMDRTFRNRIFNFSGVPDLPAEDEYDFSHFGELDKLAFPSLNDNSIEYEGRQELTASYAMLRAPLPEWIDLVGGYRLENTLMTTEISTPGKDTLWLYRVGRDPNNSTTYGLVYYESNVDPKKGAASLDQRDLLPAASLTLKPVSDFSLRLTYGETIARPTFKELTPVLYTDFDSSRIFLGNPDLKISTLKNYEARVEWHPPQKTDLVAVSFFYKTIQGAIQYTTYKMSTGSEDYIVPENYGDGEVSGFELEGRKEMDFIWRELKGLTLGANATLQSSSVTYTENLKESLAKGDVNDDSRPMDGQPEVLYNLNGVYTIQDLGLTLGLFYNIKGETYASGESWSDQKGYTPNIVELPVGTLDYSMSIRFMKRWRIGLDIKNILDPKIESVYRGPMGDLPNTTYTVGRLFGMSLGCVW
jgi:outer membrane receptor protein involved in Fe transport